jgi:type VI secretion system protein ImpE
MTTSTAEELLAAGDPAGALKALQAQVRSSAADAKLRTFLFQLLAVLGQWKRALDQLKVCGELDAGTLAMVNTYTAAVQCERVREGVFAGQTLPHVFGPPAAWVAQLAQALQLDAQGQPAAAAALREEAFEAAPASSGTLIVGPKADGPDAPEQPFVWMADADSRIGPVLEVIINGRYGWLPMVHCRAFSIEPVEDLRDLVWAPAHITFANDADTVALMPTRYAGTPLDGDGALALARRTEWVELANVAGGQYRGIGQRTLTTDAAEFGLLELRQVSFTAAA